MTLNINNTPYEKSLQDVSNLRFISWELLKNKSILITGSTGLICSYLVDLLMYRNIIYNDQITLYIVSRNKKNAELRFQSHLSSNLFNILQLDIVENIKIDIKTDYIIHGAGNANPASISNDPVGTILSNILGMNNLLQYGLRTESKRLLYISSGEVYGEKSADCFIESDYGYVDILNTRSCYPSSKRTTENLCISFAEQYGSDVVIARPCHIYGPTFTASDNRVFRQFIHNALEKKNIMMKSRGSQVRSYCYVADCATALLVILLCGENKNAYNISNKYSNISIAELAEATAQIGNQQVIFEDIENQPLKGVSIITRAVLNSDKLEKLGWLPQYNLNKGVKESYMVLSN